MRSVMTGMLMLAAAGCTASDAGKAEEAVVSTAVAFDGADYTGSDFGVAFPIVQGLWASNISRTVPAMSDAVLERLLREGVHPDREIYVMLRPRSPTTHRGRAPRRHRLCPRAGGLAQTVRDAGLLD